MTGSAGRPTERRWTAVLLSERSAEIVSWSPVLVWRHHMEAPPIPVRRRVGGPDPAPLQRAQRTAFWRQLSQALSILDDVLVLGEPELIASFADELRTEDRRAGRARQIDVRANGPLTDRQLISRARAAAGEPNRRRLVRPVPGEPAPDVSGKRPDRGDRDAHGLPEMTWPPRPPKFALTRRCC